MKCKSLDFESNTLEKRVFGNVVKESEAKHLA